LVLLLISDEAGKGERLKMKKRHAITLPEYERAFRIIHSVSRSLDDRPGASCLFYNTVGALLLEESLGIRALPVVGAAFFRLDDYLGTGLSFAKINDDGTCEGTEEHFHCWIETENHIIDFTAPVYREYLEKAGVKVDIPRKMFQKQKLEMSPSQQELRRSGDYFVVPNRHLSAVSLKKAQQSPAVGDLARVCLEWFKRPPKSIPNSLVIMNDLGEKTNIQLTKLAIVGAW
jgi:hypothetical protein